MITSMRRCVACDDLWPWPISSRSFDLDLENRVHSVTFSVLDRLFPYLPQIITTIQFWMDSFHIWYKWSLAWEGVSHVKTFDLDQCPITNASQRAHSAQPHTDVEIMTFLVLPFLDEILSNLFVYMNLLGITIQQVCSNKTLLVWIIWPNLSQTLHKKHCYGPGSQLWRMAEVYV